MGKILVVGGRDVVIPSFLRDMGYGFRANP